MALENTALAKQGEHLFISVVLPVRNEERFIEDTLRQLQAQEFPRDWVEFIVCDGESTDRTRELVQQLAAHDARIRLVSNPDRRSSSGRNIGFRMARGDVVLVIDGHVLLESLFLLDAVSDLFSTSGADALGRPQPLIPSGSGGWSEAIALARASRLGHSGSSLIYSDYEGFAPASSNGAAYRKSVFDRIGYVDESFDACEDLDFNTRLDDAGLTCFTSPRLAVRYYARETPLDLFTQMRRYGAGRYRFLRKHPSSWSLGQLLPPGLLLAFGSLPFLALLSPAYFAAAATASLLYFSCVTAYSLALASRTNWRHCLRYPVVFAVIHLGVGLGFLEGFIGRRR